MNQWDCVLELDCDRQVVSGSFDRLNEMIGRGADLRIGTSFRHNEHIDVTSPSPEWVDEVAEFGITYQLETDAGRWAAGIMSLRQPIELPFGFGARPSMSFFLYNQDGTQAIARPHLDGQPALGPLGKCPVNPPREMPKYHAADSWDEGSNAPSHNFVYDFEHFRFHVHDCWREVYAHTNSGEPISGNLGELIDVFRAGGEIKLGISGVNSDLTTRGASTIKHEIFVQGGSGYFYTEQNLFIIGTHPVVRVAAAVPMNYESRNWDFGWMMVRTDGYVVYRRCDPYTLKFSDHVSQHAVRWFVR